ncbi:choice-of-anchor L domain-containing protein [Psychroserpens sp. SPM9]|uniref:choice-of-anchor L domain-containing protein n=1 Tax=Psychroserpens sp. SPM9 TaxID=2975598 RepID=UPI0021A5BBDA|nr:choice-of-anchor L domain-containing protein [Psychroserpens sp. SPM9]MDG5492382.1 choice-of-anchor L domain-containing protein [Psychroserpens sp. SPM9]
MKSLFKILCLFITVMTYGQNITVDSQTFTPQQLVEDILIDSECINNVVVTNVVGGNFDNTDQSFGFFDATGTTFPFETGIVLSTGRLANVPGPNDNLSDDNAPNWLGDNDLETILNETNTTNATILEFEFTSVATEISFRYIFASEEYQEGNPNTCQFSDLFGFLIRPVDGPQYTNIALVPGTNTPVKVTTVHPDLPGCSAENEAYFEGFNPVNSPTNFAGQTKILTATAQVIPNETYHVKLVIADEQNFRFDSAVFLEAGSFRLSTDLGPDRLIANGNPICGDDTFQIQTSEPGNTNIYKWFKDGVELLGETGTTLDISESGVYNVEITKNTCVLFGEVIIEYAPNPAVVDAVLVECDQNQDGLTFYNLYDAESLITNNDSALSIVNFFLTEADAIVNDNAISEPNNFQNTNPFQTVYARVINQANCFSIAELELQISNNTISIAPLEACDGDTIDGIADFNLGDITTSIENQIPMDANVSFYETEADAFLETNALPNTFQNTTPNTQTIFVKIKSNNQCFAISTAELVVLYTPVLLNDETVMYCLNTFPETITLVGGVLNDAPNNYYYEWLFNGNSTSVNTTFNEINEAGTYTVIVTDPNGCDSSRTITVLASNNATIEDIIITEGTSNNTVTIEVSGEGDYEYALDEAEGEYQTENTFANVPPGFHTVFVRDINGCGITEQVISVLGFPKFFTPNGDPFHEYWHVYGVNTQFNQGIDIKIFNRYGKLLTQLNNTSVGWDGTFNGQPLPSDDYWFTVQLLDGRTFTGHFALRR